MSDNYKVIRKEIRFEGAVQGVGFRYRAKYAASGCRVLMEAQGTAGQINEMLKIINKGNYIRIDRMNYREIPVDESERGFHVR